MVSTRSRRIVSTTAMVRADRRVSHPAALFFTSREVKNRDKLDDLSRQREDVVGRDGE
jgi:hypothetical protein